MKMVKHHINLHRELADKYGAESELLAPIILRTKTY